MSIHRLETLFPDQLRERLAQSPILVLPFGTIEWHSHHLPLGLDGLVAAALGERIADQADAVLVPVSYWGVGGVPFPHTLNLPATVIEPLLEKVFEQFGAMGFRVIVAFTGHFGLDHTITLKRSALAVMRRSTTAILPVAEYDFTTDIGYAGDHAGIGETSLMWAIDPNLVKLESVPTDQALEGIIGEDPRGKASREWGEKLMETISTRTAEVARRFPHEDSAARNAFIEALQAGVQVLERTAEQRRLFSRDKVPPIVTPAYREYCQAIYRGDYHAAGEFAARKLANLAE
jgi:creatinine amidohydrolase